MLAESAHLRFSPPALTSHLCAQHGHRSVQGRLNNVLASATAYTQHFQNKLHHLLHRAALYKFVLTFLNE